MNLDRLTFKAREAFQEAQKKAEGLQHQQIDEAHLALALLEQKEGIIPPLLKKIGVSMEPLQRKVEEPLKRIPSVSGPGAAGAIHITQALGALLSRAEGEAAQLKDEYISTEHLFLALLDPKSGVAGLF